MIDCLNLADNCESYVSTLSVSINNSKNLLIKGPVNLLRTLLIPTVTEQIWEKLESILCTNTKNILEFLFYICCVKKNIH